MTASLVSSLRPQGAPNGKNKLLSIDELAALMRAIGDVGKFKDKHKEQEGARDEKRANAVDPAW